MKRLAKIIVATAALGLAGDEFVADAGAQAYPAKSIRLVVPVAAGGNMDVRTRFAQQGVELQSSPTPEHFTEYIKTEFARWAKVIQEAGITAE